MRIYSNSFELMSELGRELNSYGQTVKPKTYQNKVIEGNEEFETKELPKALIGFAGPRVIEQTVREKLPEGFQRSEFLLKKGAVDMIVDRREMRANIAEIIAMLMRKRITDAAM